MGGFDTLALPDKAFGNGNIASLNAKLHESKAYNSGMTSTTSCFVAGTSATTAVGLVAIENIKIGDMAVETKAHSGFHHSGEASVLRVNYKE